METEGMWRRLDAIQSMSLPCLLISKLLLVAIPIAQIAMGVVYLNECPKQHYIPLYLVVCGVFSTVRSLLSCLPCNKKEEDGSSSGLNILCNVWNGLVFAFMFCWFISGSVWIYSIYPPNYNSTMPGEPYCNKTLYLFAFWTTTVTYIILAGLLVAVCCALICVCVCTAKGGVSNV
ncbi:transmembrane protein 272-like [Salminus brasiliensis]|uniref:transmembrane protein 272-like n=1 Tax=Salminus brasiliensis TaxID=930266 RepID=UPI003B834B3B